MRMVILGNEWTWNEGNWRGEKGNEKKMGVSVGME